MKNQLKAQLDDGKVPVGTMVLEFDTTGVARLAASAGADWVLFDMEHSGWSTSRIRQAMALARGAGIVPVVRPPQLQYHLCSVPLDMGALGIMAPMVESVEQAELLVSSCRYPPLGRRGACFGIAHDGYVMGTPSEIIQEANTEILTIAMIETPLGVENIDSIIAVEGLDMLWVGHFDLTSMMGIPGQFDHPDFLSAVDTVVSAAKAHGKPIGIVAGSVDDAKARLEQGFNCLLYGVDLYLYQKALADGIAGVRELLGHM